MVDSLEIIDGPDHAWMVDWNDEQKKMNSRKACQLKTPKMVGWTSLGSGWVDNDTQLSPASSYLCVLELRWIFDVEMFGKVVAWVHHSTHCCCFCYVVVGDTFFGVEIKISKELK